MSPHEPPFFVITQPPGLCYRCRRWTSASSVVCGHLLSWLWGFQMWSFLPTSQELSSGPCYLGTFVKSVAGHLPSLSFQCLVSASTSGHFCHSALTPLRHSTGSHRFLTCSPAPTCRFSTQRSIFHYSFSCLSVFSFGLLVMLFF